MNKRPYNRIDDLLGMFCLALLVLVSISILLWPTPPAGVCFGCPADFPAYPNAFFQDEDRKFNGTPFNGHARTLAFSTRDSETKVRQFYEDALLGSGWHWNSYKTYLLRGPESAPEFCFDPRIISS
ncbi:MAG: hypothetical protein ACJ78Q_01440, partial [Chloroflexia bacterium]